MGRRAGSRRGNSQNRCHLPGHPEAVHGAQFRCAVIKKNQMAMDINTHEFLQSWRSACVGRPGIAWWDSVPRWQRGLKQPLSSWQGDMPFAAARPVLLCRRHLLEQMSETRQRCVDFHHLHHGPQCGLIGGDDRLVELSLPCGDALHRRKIASGTTRMSISGRSMRANASVALSALRALIA